jgi:hypothetical protein
VVAGYLASFGLKTTRVATLLVASYAFVLWSSDAHAQNIPWIVVPLAAAPIIAVVFSVALGLMTKSWTVGLGNTGLVLVRGIWFVAASKYSDSDLMVWGAIAALGLHLLVMVSLVVQQPFAAREFAMTLKPVVNVDVHRRLTTRGR